MTTPFAERLAAALAADDVAQARAELAAELTLAPADVDVTRIGSPNGVHNVPWQGEPLGRHFRAELFVVRYPCEDAEIERVVRAVRERMHPGPNGFDAVAVCHHDGGRWTVGRVVEYAHSSVGARLRAALPGLITETVTQDPFPPAPPEMTEADDYPTADEVIGHLSERPNVILQGPPGSGKTRLAMEVVRRLAAGTPAEDGRLDRFPDLDALRECPVVWELVQMHPGYAYEDFVRGLATAEGQGLRFVPRDRVFLQMCAAAEARGRKPTVLLMDEVNRCDLSSVLGELIVALDRRGTGVRLQYPPPPGGRGVVAVPPNLWVIGTMNTSDRSVALVDFAVRRRFRFLDVPPSAGQLRHYYRRHPARAAQAAALLDALGRMVERDGLAPGHSYLMVPADDDDAWRAGLARRLAYEVLPLLREYGREGLLRGGELRVGGRSWGDVRAVYEEAFEHTCRERLGDG